MADLLGHTNAAVTLNVYTHATADMKRSAAEAIGNVMEQAF